MTSLPIVPSKFYQVCRLCLTIVSDTNDLLNLSVFGSHNAGCMANTTTATNSTTTADDCNSPAVNAATKNKNISSGSGSGSSNNVGVIVKTNSKNSTPTNEHKNVAASNNPSDNEAAAAADDASGRDTGNAGKTTAVATEVSRGNNTGDDDNNNFKIDGDLHQSDILERIHTFLSITVSGRIFYPSFVQQLFFIHLLYSSSVTMEHVHLLRYLFIKGSFVLMLERVLFIPIVITAIGRMYSKDKTQ